MFQWDYFIGSNLKKKPQAEKYDSNFPAPKKRAIPVLPGIAPSSA
jgi:hypothetical protein